MEFPKMLYSVADKFADQKALEAAIHSRALRMLIVKSADEQAAATDWTEDLASLIKRGPGRPKGT